MTDQHTVVDTAKTAAQQAVTDASAPGVVDDLDKLLEEFDRTVKPAPAVTQPEPKTTPEAEAPAPIANDRIARLEQRLFQEDLNEAVTKIFGEVKVPRRVALGWIDQIARENPQVAQAFMNKSNDPKTWDRFVKTLSKEAEKDFKASDIDHGVTADTAAVVASMRGASTKVTAEPAPNLGHMSDAELRDYTRKNFGF